MLVLASKKIKEVNECPNPNSGKNVNPNNFLMSLLVNTKGVHRLKGLKLLVLTYRFNYVLNFLLTSKKTEIN